MRRFAVAVILLTMAVAGFAQPQGQQQQPWSEQLPIPQYPQAGPGPQAPQLGAPQSGAPQDDGSAPDRGVARVSYMNGNVSVRRGDSGELVAAIVNAPLVAGDRIVTSDTGRAEVQFDALNVIRLAPATEVRLSELAYHRYQIQIAAGTTIFRVVRDSDAQVELSTPSVAMRPLKAGVYRVSVMPDGTSQITVRLGDGEVFSPRGSEPLHQGQTMVARGSASDPEFQLSNPPANDEFERWCVLRDRLLERSLSSPQYVPRDVAGTEDMADNGRWVNDGSYGNVWAPNVATADPNWAPYSCGRWVWLDYYGWSWVGCESWGWAPYHYGRWYHASFGWAWWPGVYNRPYYWRPALVGFFGWGGGVGVGFGFGNLGWCPLAPFEVFHPWYGRGFYGGFRGGNFVSVNAFNTFHNARFTNAVTSVRAGEFGRGSIGRDNIVRANQGDLARAGAIHGQLPMTPSHESTRFSDRAASSQGLPRTSDSMRFASHMQTPQSNRMSFEQQRQGFSQGISRSASNGNGFGGNSGANSGGVNSAVRSGGAPAGGSNPLGGANSTGNNSGWQRFDPSTHRGGSNGNSGGGNPSVGNTTGGNLGASRSSGNLGGNPNGQINGGQSNGQGNGGYRGYSGSPSGVQQGPQGGRPVGPGSQPSYQPQSRPGYQQPQSRPGYSQQPAPRSYTPQQPVHINPPIVQNRGGSGGSSSSGSGGSRPSGGGVGGSHPSGGGASHSSGGGGHHR